MTKLKLGGKYIVKDASTFFGALVGTNNEKKETLKLMVNGLLEAGWGNKEILIALTSLLRRELFPQQIELKDIILRAREQSKQEMVEHQLNQIPNI